VEFKAEDIEDLRRRLEKAKWPDELEDEEWQYGVDKTYLKVRSAKSVLIEEFELVMMSSLLLSPLSRLVDYDSWQSRTVICPGLGSVFRLD
jgi:hypothetical protein